MKTFRQFISEEVVRNFTNWVKPSKDDIALEYKVEYQIKPLKRETNDAFPTLQDFEKAVKDAEVIELTDSVDRKIANRSHTRTKEDIISLIRGYASYPQFRNEKTVEAIYEGFRQNKPMKMPFILKMPNGRMRIMAGNTRADIAKQLGVTPKALLIEVPEK